MSREAIENSQALIQEILDQEFTDDGFEIVMTEIRNIERNVQSVLNVKNERYIVERLYLQSEPSDCCNGCVKVPQLYHAFTDESYQVSNSDFQKLKGEIEQYLVILHGEMS